MSGAAVDTQAPASHADDTEVIARRASSQFSLDVRRRRRRVVLDVRNAPELPSDDDDASEQVPSPFRDVQPLPLATRQRAFLMLTDIAERQSGASGDERAWRAWALEMASKLDVDEQAARAVYGSADAWR